jgi:uncharacterized protein
MQTYLAGEAEAPLLVLAHGAGAGERHPWMRRVAKGFSSPGVSVVTFEFPYLQAGRSVPDKGPVLEEAYLSAWRQIATTVGEKAVAMFAGGKSMGGRIASQVAAQGGFKPAPAGLVFFGYPLHPPGKPAQRRDQHLGHILPPMVFLQGTRDPFGSPDEMQSLMASLPNATLHLTEGGNHSLEAPKRDDPEGASIERAIDLAVAWIRAAIV